MSSSTTSNAAAWDHDDRRRLAEAATEVAHEAISNAEQLVGGGTSHGDFDSGLEAAPERPKILFHDRQLQQPEDQGYSSPCAA